MSQILNDYLLVESKRPPRGNKAGMTIKKGERFFAQRLSEHSILVYFAWGPPLAETLEDYEIVGEMQSLFDADVRNQMYSEMKNTIKILQEEKSIKPNITKVISNNRATIVFFDDGEKVVVKLQKGDKKDLEKAIMAACSKKLLGSYTEVLNALEKIEKNRVKYCCVLGQK
jgi:hypothetical protein